MISKALKTNPLFRLLFANGLAGIAAAAILTAGLLLTDVGGLGHLVANSSSPVLPVALLFASLSITLASVAMGVAVMRLPTGDGPDTGHRKRLPPLFPQKTPQRAYATVRPRRR
ncbi:hypothetical protein [Rhodobium gokarnense]|uniref:Uncharacterized protein n=1 Tax=Rhodobium gokarnense TaxID=364296 RepID=A0ABT3HAM1_9HYPH|nr:hypothetical protein [Rhodobium gokarnense]MCW2307446.1 hypothetical protein [Rhodobium gokarnense]